MKKFFRRDNAPLTTTIKRRFWRSAAECSIGSLVLLLFTVIFYRLNLNLATASLFYVTVIVLISRFGNFVPAIFSSVIAALCLAHLAPPLFSFRVDDPLDELAIACFLGSERESVRTRILRSFLQSDELGLGGRQALRLQEQIVHVAISSATPEQRFDVAVHRFDHSHRHLGPAIVEDTLQVIQ